MRSDECVFTAGGKLAIFNAVEVLIEHGDEVIVPMPFWVSYKDIIEFAGGKPVFVETNEAENFRVTVKMIEAAITPKTKAIILNTPSNPVGRGDADGGPVRDCAAGPQAGHLRAAG